MNARKAKIAFTTGKLRSSVHFHVY
jgi:hypothetical protein